MLKLNNKAQSCSIKFSGYQFPESDDEYDANWLNTEVNYSDERGTLSTAALLTMEVEETLERIRFSRDWKSGFFEPDISISIKSGILDLSLSYNLVERIPTKTPPIYSFSFNLNKDKDRREISQLFEDALAMFPVRSR